MRRTSRAAAAGFGVDAGPVRVDMARVKARKDEISGQSRTGVESGLRGLANCTVIQGHARFTGPREIARRRRAPVRRIGSSSTWAGARRCRRCRGSDSVSFLTNTSVLDLDVLPEHLIVIGGSYIGLEFGQAFRRFGSEVTIVEMGDRLIRARRHGRLRRGQGHSGGRRHSSAVEREVHRLPRRCRRSSWRERGL